MSEKSPLEKLVDFQQRNKNLPVRVEPKSRKIRTVVPLIEDADISTCESIPDGDSKLLISNSSLTMNFNFNIDSETMDKVLEKSAEAAKKIAAAGAAVLGTAIFFNSKKSNIPKRPRVVLKPRVKVPRIFKSD
jgi:hypothetical protein